MALNDKDLDTRGRFHPPGPDYHDKRESPRQMVASNWREVRRGSLRGFFSLTLPSGLILCDCQLHETADSRWVGLPGKPQIEDGRHRLDPKTGRPAYTPTVLIAQQRREAFQAQALAALDRLRRGEP